MSKNVVWVIFVLLVFPVEYSCSWNGKILYVGGEGEGNYTKIQDAINDAKDGYIIYVYPGYYNESLCINKSITIIGADRNNTIIDGCGAYSAVYFIADGVNFSGFTIKNSSVAIYLQSNRNNIYENIIENCKKAFLIENADNNTIRDNIIRNINKSSEGYKFSLHNLLKKSISYSNSISSRYLHAFFSNYQLNVKTICVLLKCSNGCKFIRNKFYDCDGLAINVISSKNINISGNEFDNLDYGIVCDFVSFIKIGHNKFLGGDLALQFANSYNVSVIGNEIRNYIAFENGFTIGTGIATFYSDTIKILDNMMHNINLGIITLKTNNVSISNNFITNISGGIISNDTKEESSVAIALVSSSYGAVKENYIENANNGVFIMFAKNINIEKNKLKDINAYTIDRRGYSSSGVGINGLFVKNFSIKNNEIEKVNFCAIQLFLSSNAVLQNNSIKDIGGKAPISKKRGIGIIILFSKNNKIIENYLHNISSCSLILIYSLKNSIHLNRFYGKPCLTYIHATFLNSFLNNWNKNYWESWKWKLPKPIAGIYLSPLFTIPWINFDWQPMVN